MRTVSFVTSTCFMLSLVVFSFGDEPNGEPYTPEKIAGTWQGAKGGDVRKGRILEFTKSGTFKVSKLMAEDSKDGKKTPPTTVTVLEGTFTIEGDRLVMTGKRNGEEEKKAFTIKSLTDKSLILGEEGRTSVFEKK